MKRCEPRYSRFSRACCRTVVAVCLLTVVSWTSVIAGPTDPVTGAAFDSLIAAQHVEIQGELEAIVPEAQGILVTGPLDPLLHHTKDEVTELYRALRVICPNLSSLYEIETLMRSDSRFGRVKTYIEKPRGGDVTGFRGLTAVYTSQSGEWPVVFATIQQTRWLIWARENVFVSEAHDLDGGDLRSYAKAVSDYLYAVDRGDTAARLPDAAEFDLPEWVDFYEPPPGYVIEGYQNYKEYLHRHAAIETPFANNILAFVPGDSLVEIMIALAPESAYPNKEAPMLQHEYRKFCERGGTVRIMETLTRRGFDTLLTGEYFFAVGVTGKIRFGRELLREEVERIEAATGRKVPRANHAFLFPGEPVLTAGAFFVERASDGRPYISRINAQSGHYFYSNVTPTIREDIAVHSNEYVLTLGHLLAALTKLEIPFDSVLISKL